MRYFRGLIVLAGLTGSLASFLFSQATSVAIVDPAKELKRAANQLRISVDQLRNAREARNQATELAGQSSSESTFSEIAADWARIDRTRAPGVLAHVYGSLRARARDASDAAIYQRCMASAQQLMRSLTSLDSDLAASLWQQWPDPPAALGDLATGMRDQAARFSKQLAGGGSGRGTARGAGSLDIVGTLMPVPTEEEATAQAARGDYSVVASLVGQLDRSGDRVKALRLVDQIIVDFSKRDPDQEAISSYSYFVRQLPNKE